MQRDADFGSRAGCFVSREKVTLVTISKNPYNAIRNKNGKNTDPKNF